MHSSRPPQVSSCSHQAVPADIQVKTTVIYLPLHQTLSSFSRKSSLLPLGGTLSKCFSLPWWITTDVSCYEIGILTPCLWSVIHVIIHKCSLFTVRYYYISKVTHIKTNAFVTLSCSAVLAELVGVCSSGYICTCRASISSLYFLCCSCSCSSYSFCSFALSSFNARVLASWEDSTYIQKAI